MSIVLVIIITIILSVLLSTVLLGVVIGKIVAVNARKDINKMAYEAYQKELERLRNIN
jgi:NADH:ubiquinone oxidoreductase subunit 3 (subunit A)